ncbi:hypothetical protein [Heyndrickxia ginsengihumi]|uniref:hypothetical protein n=1 Tax=Heyndrickxia ginsengihumi TaxID=363870 RepID=UPI003D1B597C
MGKHRTSGSNEPWLSDSYRTSSSSSYSDQFTTSNNSLNTSNLYSNTNNTNSTSNTTIYCDPEYIVNDTYVEREITYVHPIIRVNKKHIVNVPKHVYKKVTKNVVIDPGIPDECDDCDKHEKKHKKHHHSKGKEW